MLTKRKKIIVLVVMFALLVATAVLNYTLALGASGNGGGNVDVISTGNFFTSYRSERLAARNQQIAELNEIIALEGDEFAAQRAEATDSKMRLISILEMETTLENILKAQGYEDAAVTIGLLSDNVNIIIKSDELTSEESGRIYNLIYEEAKIAPDYVRIYAI